MIRNGNRIENLINVETKICTFVLSSSSHTEKTWNLYRHCKNILGTAGSGTGRRPLYNTF